jgi:hypothetical protein
MAHRIDQTPAQPSPAPEHSRPTGPVVQPLPVPAPRPHPEHTLPRRTPGGSL